MRRMQDMHCGALDTIGDAIAVDFVEAFIQVVFVDQQKFEKIRQILDITRRGSINYIGLGGTSAELWNLKSNKI